MGIAVVALRRCQGCRQQLPALPFEAAGDEVAIGQIPAHAFRMLPELRLAEQRLGMSILQDEHMLRRRQTPVERNEQRAETGAGEHQRQELRAVEAEIGHPVAAPDAVDALERPGMGMDHRGEVTVADGTALVVEGRLVRREISVPVNPGGKLHQSSLSPFS